MGVNYASTRVQNTDAGATHQPQSQFPVSGDDQPSDPGAHEAGSGAPVWSLILGAIVGAVTLAAVFSSAGGIQDVLVSVRGASPGWLLAALVAEAACYLLLGRQLRQLSGGPRITQGQGTRISLVSMGLGNILPGAPAPGVLLAGTALRALGQSPRRTRLMLGLSMWFSVRTLVALGAVVFLVAIARDHPGLREFTVWALLAVVLIVTLAITQRMAARPQTARLFGRLRVGRPRPRADLAGEAAAAWYAEGRAIVGTPAHRVLLASLSAGAWILDGICLGLALASVGVHVAPDTLLLVYVGGMFVSALPLLPGGLGAVEAAIPALLHHFGAPLETALAGTLIYRGISLLLPAALGALALTYSGLLRRRPARR